MKIKLHYCSSLQVGTRRAYKLFTFTSVDELKKLHENGMNAF